MKTDKPRLTAVAACLLVAAVMLTADVTPQQRYIDKYKAVAVEEMYRSGVPASITLAQGMLESRYGLSELAASGHNHFGIKCHNDWKGRTMHVDDDRKGECFRVYRDASESFRDHSDFLRFRDRYKSLFELDITDYKGWAYGLSKAGYATDPAYPQKLIRLIEEYGLARFDSGDVSGGTSAPEMSSQTGGGAAEVTAPVDSGRERKSQSKSSARKSRSRKDKRTAAAAEERGSDAAAPATQSRRSREKTRTVQRTRELPVPPSVLEQSEPVEESRAHEVFHIPLTRKLYTQNGVPFVYSEEGESYASIAEDYDLFPGEILKFNDLTAASELAPGTQVYIRAKKTRAAPGVDKYIVEQDGEQLRDICQRFGVRMKSVLKRNGFAEDRTLREGDTVRLR